MSILSIAVIEILKKANGPVLMSRLADSLDVDAVCLHEAIKGDPMLRVAFRRGRKLEQAKVILK